MSDQHAPMLRYEDLVLECTRCGGTGWYREGDGRSGREGTCPNCGGLGGQLTEQGRELAKFTAFLRKIGRL
jgi:DnaJ-class molecular chaperone